MKIIIIDYGLSNLLSVKRAFERCGARAEISGLKEDISAADALVLPGVGAFADGMEGLRSRGLTEPIREKAENGAPLLAICLGMQMLFTKSDEFGEHEGLGIIPGAVTRIPDADALGAKQRVPHVGWSALLPGADGFGGTLLEDFGGGEEAYFVHSYEAAPDDPASVLAWCEYGARMICAAARNKGGNVTGCQFHPEKSGEAGLTIISRFISSIA